MIYFFRTMAAAISIYSLMCVARIILTWIPGACETGPGRFLCALCDHYLNLFRTGWLRFGVLDLSPLVAIVVLSMATYVMQNLSMGAKVTFGVILALVIQMVWTVASSVLIFLIIILAVRLIVFLSGADRASSLWAQVDASLNPFVYSITRFFSGGRPVAYKSALILSIVLVALLRIGGAFIVAGLVKMCAMIPF